MMMMKQRSAQVLIVALLVAASGEVALMPQQRQPDPRGAGMPAIHWNEDQIRAAVPVRVGRRLTPKSWPNGAKVAVALTFEVTGEASGVAANQSLPVPLSAQEFGTLRGLPRVLEVLDRHGVPATFFVSAMDAKLHPENVSAIQTRGRHELALSGWMHENLGQLNDEAEEQRLLTQSIDALTKIAGRKPVGWRAPGWTFSRQTLPQILTAGFLYDSSMMGRNEPYEINANDRPTGLIELPVDGNLNDEPYFTTARSLPSPDLIFKVYQDEFDVAFREGTMMLVTLHPYVVGHRSRIAHLDRLIAYMKAKPAVWFATAEQIATYVKQRG